MSIVTRRAPDEARKGRLSLKTWRPSNCSELPGVEQSEHSTHSRESQFEMALWAARNEWDIARRRLPQDAEAWLRGGGFAGRGKLSKLQAEDLLTRAFRALDGAR
jgi:hypothetical protein